MTNDKSYIERANLYNSLTSLKNIIYFTASSTLSGNSASRNESSQLYKVPLRDVNMLWSLKSWSYISMVSRVRGQICSQVAFCKPWQWVYCWYSSIEPAFSSAAESWGRLRCWSFDHRVSCWQQNQEWAWCHWIKPSQTLVAPRYLFQVGQLPVLDNRI